MAVFAYVGLGSNMGNRHAALDAALQWLRPLRVSPVTETLPWGLPDQPPFLNAVAEIGTETPPETLLGSFQAQERRQGRRTTRPWGPRVLDLDLLLYGDRIIRTPRLEVPHPYLSRRRFVLEGLAALCPGRPVPGLGLTIRELLEAAA